MLTLILILLWILVVALGGDVGCLLYSFKCYKEAMRVFFLFDELNL